MNVERPIIGDHYFKMEMTTKTLNSKAEFIKK